MILAAASASALTLGGIGAASAMTAGAIPLAGAQPEVTLVAGGCGPGFHRGPYGGCRPNFGWRRGYGWRPGWHRWSAIPTARTRRAAPVRAVTRRGDPR